MIIISDQKVSVIYFKPIAASLLQYNLQYKRETLVSSLGKCSNFTLVATTQSKYQLEKLFRLGLHRLIFQK